jgi:hypothetical protein
MYDQTTQQTSVTISRHNNIMFPASRPSGRAQRGSPIPPKNAILLPNLSPRPTLDVDKLSSPEFRDALQTAKENRSNDGPSNCRLRTTLSSETLSPSHPNATSHITQDSDGDHTKRMHTRVAVRDNLKAPHHFQIVPLHEVKRLRVPVGPTIPLVPPGKSSTSREKRVRKTFVAPESHKWYAGLTITPVSGIHMRQVSMS